MKTGDTVWINLANSPSPTPMNKWVKVEISAFTGNEYNRTVLLDKWDENPTHTFFRRFDDVMSTQEYENSRGKFLAEKLAM